jgi:hypothetical protein
MRFWLVAACAMAANACIVVDGGGIGDGTTDPTIPDGRVEVTWQIGPSSCGEAGIAEVEITIASQSERFPCADEGGALSVPAGAYGLNAIGYDIEGQPRYGGSVEGVRVYSGEVTTAETVILSALPATISGTWFFDNGRLCSANGVNTIELTLFDLSDTLKAQVEAPCDDGASLVGEVDAGDYVLVAFGRTTEGVVNYRGEAATTVARGDSVVLDVELFPETD